MCWRTSEGSPLTPRFSRLQEQELQSGAADGAGGGESADEAEGFFVVALAAGRRAAVGRDQGGAEVGDEECGLAVGREVFQARHDFGPGEERGRGGERERGVPMEKTMAGEAREEFREEVGGGGVEGGVEGGGELGVRGGLGLELGETKGDRAFDLFREVEVVAGDVREEGVDEMQAAQVVAGGGGHRGEPPS